jgi:thiol-disulfide isomerase/thioredoxin
MGFVPRKRLFRGTLSLLLASTAGQAWAQTPTAADALKLTPVQKDVEFDRPSADEAAKATIAAEKVSGQTGWVVKTAEGRTLRRFIDTNGDNVVDEWCYYAAGQEVYRDIDQNFNGKADQYRWLNMGGSRWGLDTNEDGKIDSWKSISAEEASEELVQAIANRDTARFSRLLISADELSGLGLGKEHLKAIGDKVEKAADKFKTLLDSQKAVSKDTQWIQFGGQHPGVVPSGTEGSTKDVIVYENAVVMVKTDDKHEQVPIGTLVQVGSSWRLIDADSTPFFFTATVNGPVTPTDGGNTTTGSEKILNDLLEKLQELDRKTADAAGPGASKLHAERAEVVEKIAELSSKEDRSNWYRQLADTISAAAQSGAFPEGVARLKTLRDKLAEAKSADDSDLLPYVEFRYLRADYGASMLAPNANFVEIQKKWLESLQKFVQDYPKSSETAEAMLELGMAQEFAGDEEKAKEWYGNVADKFPTSPHAKKASGAKTRLQCVGQAIPLNGRSIQSGNPVNLANYRGKVVVIQYWATWCEPAKTDMAQLKELVAKYGKDLAIIGVSLDNNKNDLLAFLKQNKGVSWPQLYEDGGLDSPLANSLGILTVPTMLLVDKQGKVVNRGITANELDKEVGTLLR